MSLQVSRLSKKFQKKCALDGCNNLFWSNGTQKYCSNFCFYIARAKQMHDYQKEHSKHKWTQYKEEDRETIEKITDMQRSGKTLDEINDFLIDGMCFSPEHSWKIIKEMYLRREMKK